MVNQLSREVYHGFVKGTMENRQNAMVILFMRRMDQPTTIRSLHRIMNAKGYMIDLVSLRRAVHNLAHGINAETMLEVAFEKPCPITEKKVGWYKLKDQYRQTVKQGELFNQATA